MDRMGEASAKVISQFNVNPNCIVLGIRITFGYHIISEDLC